jgi:gliding motility-associated-like protein
MKSFSNGFYQALCLCFTASLLSFSAFAQPANDDPCNATPLTVGSSCVYVAGTTVNATASAGVPAPGCASYGGPDVWYSVTVPASGTINFDSNTGTITDGGMAVYSGACGSLSLVSCNDDGSANGAMPYIGLTGQTPGATLYIRFWKYSSGTGTFSICVTEPTPAPPCGASPPAGDACSNATPICDLNGYCGNTSSSYGVDSWSQLTSTFCGSIENNSFLTFVASNTSISFDVWVNSYTLGYGIQILIFSATNCSGAVTQYGPCYNPASVPPGSVNITANGLTVGNTYYIMIDGNSGDVCNYTIGANTGISLPVVITPGSSTICQGQSVALTATGGNGSYTWDASPDLSATTGSSVTATPPTTPGIYSYTANSTTGNALCPSSTSATATITVSPCGCTVTATNSGPVCFGTNTIDLFASSVTNAITYSWTGPNGFTSSDQNPVGVVIPTAPGSYDYTVTVDDGGTPCTSTTTVIVNALPTVNAGLDQTSCGNESIILSGSGAQSYVWDNGVSNGVGFIPGATTTYTVTGTDANGCENTDQTVVTVESLPVISAGTDQMFCVGNSTTLNGSGGVSYSWDNGVTDGASFNPSTTTTYTVTGTDANGCENTDQVTITVNQLPAIDAGATQTVCANESVILNGSGGVSYGWNNGVTNGVSFTPLATATYTVTGTDVNGCQNTDQVTVTVNPLPNVSAGIDQSVCIGGSVTLNGSGAVSYAWNNGITNGVSFTPATTTTYTVTGTDANGCQNTDQVTVTVNPLPTIDAGSDQNICVGTAVVLSGSGGVSYVWSNGVTNNNSFSPGEGTVTYTVTGTDANGCQNTDQVTVNVLPVPIAYINSGGTLTGYPGLQVTFTNGSQFADSYSVDFDNGQTAASVVLSDTYTSSFNVPGIYDVVLTASNGICYDTSEMHVIIVPFEPLSVNIPNVFTPDGDGTNDEFYIEATNAVEMNVIILNRWQNLIMEINDLSTHWDGTINGNEASEGVYFFKYTVKGKDGTTQTGQGFVELIRK